jgi:hypothetical protein
LPDKGGKQSEFSSGAMLRNAQKKTIYMTKLIADARSAAASSAKMTA